MGFQFGGWESNRLKPRLEGTNAEPLCGCRQPLILEHLPIACQFLVIRFKLCLRRSIRHVQYLAHQTVHREFDPRFRGIGAPWQHWQDQRRHRFRERREWIFGNIERIFRSERRISSSLVLASLSPKQEGSWRKNVQSQHPSYTGVTVGTWSKGCELGLQNPVRKDHVICPESAALRRSRTFSARPAVMKDIAVW